MVLLLTVFLANGIAVTLHDNNVEIIWLVVAISAIMLYKFYGDIFAAGGRPDRAGQPVEL